MEYQWTHSKTMTPRFNVQGSIQEVDIEWARNLLKTKDINLLPTEADTIEKPLDATDGRLAVIRQIKQRRGQRKFREKLLVKHENALLPVVQLLTFLRQHISHPTGMIHIMTSVMDYF